MSWSAEDWREFLRASTWPNVVRLASVVGIELDPAETDPVETDPVARLLAAEKVVNILSLPVEKPVRLVRISVGDPE